MEDRAVENSTIEGRTVAERTVEENAVKDRTVEGRTVVAWLRDDYQYRYPAPTFWGQYTCN